MTPGGKFSEYKLKQTSIFSIKNVIVLHWIAVAPYFPCPKKEQLRILILSRPNLRKYAGNPQKPQNLKKIFCFRLKTLFFNSPQESSKLVFYRSGGAIFCRRLRQHSQKLRTTNKMGVNLFSIGNG